MSDVRWPKMRSENAISADEISFKRDAAISPVSVCTRAARAALKLFEASSQSQRNYEVQSKKTGEVRSAN